jgi:hypothetical protein
VAAQIPINYQDICPKKDQGVDIILKRNFTGFVIVVLNQSADVKKILIDQSKF